MRESIRSFGGWQFGELYSELQFHFTLHIESKETEKNHNKNETLINFKKKDNNLNRWQVVFEKKVTDAMNVEF